MLVVVPVDERRHPLTGLVFGGKWLAGVFKPILHLPEQRFRLRVFVGDPWPGERSEHVQFFQAALQRGRTQLFEKPAARRCRCLHGGSAAAFVPC